MTSLELIFRPFRDYVTSGTSDRRREERTMINKKQAFLSILKVEMADLEKDVELLIRRLQEDRKGERISNYVFLENLALMQRELFGVESFSDYIGDIDENDFDSLPEMIESILQRFDCRAKSSGLPRSVGHLVRRKVEKVRRYVEREV